MFYLKNNNFTLLKFLCVVLFQIFIENLIQQSLGENTIFLSVSVLFILNLSLFIYFESLRLFFGIQLITFFLFAFIMLPHFYYFNFYSFYARTNYIVYDLKRFSFYLILLVSAICIIYLCCLLQFKQLQNLRNKQFIIFSFIAVLILLKVILQPINFTFKQRSFTIKFINQNRLIQYKTDYDSFKAGGDKIENYHCQENNNVSPTIRFLLTDNSKKQLLILIESWGILKDDKAQLQFINYIMKEFGSNKLLKKEYKINHGKTCFNGNTSSAEGRELLNMNNEESYRAFLNKDIMPQYNIVRYKNLKNYYTVAGFSGSKVYGSNWSNVEGFRIKSGFKSRFYYEELKFRNEPNIENTYVSVNDEVMIDSLFEESKKHEKIFAYGLTINSHVPFNLDKRRVNLIDYSEFTYKFMGVLKENKSINDQLYRINTIIQYILKKLVSTNDTYDKILIIGDHPYPDLYSDKMYSNKEVPYMLMKKIN